MEFVQNIFTSLFDGLETTQSYKALIGLGIAYLLGLWTAWLIWGRLASRRRQTALRLESELNAQKAEYQVLNEQYQQKELDFNNVSSELVHVHTQVKDAENEVRQMHNQLLTLKDENINLQTDIDTYLKKIDTLDNQLISLQTKNIQLNEEIEETADSMHNLAAVQSSYNATRDRLQAVEEKIALLVGENQNLKVELKSIKNNSTNHSTDQTASNDNYDNNVIVDSAIVPPTTPNKFVSTNENDEEEDDEQEEEVDAAAARLAIQNAIGPKIKAATADEKNDLEKINGIGSFIESKLNDLGIYTYEQISQWDDPMIEAVTTAIEFFPGRIKRDDWVGQAKKLMGESTATAIKQNKKRTNNKKSTDLKVIEGVGPKIEQVLKKGGIKTWSDLADSSTESIQAVLKKAGGHYRLADPSTWVAQARLADAQEWDKLKEYQDSLHGGKEPTKK